MRRMVPKESDWELYFSGEPFNIEDPRLVHVSNFFDIFRTEAGFSALHLQENASAYSVHTDFNELKEVLQLEEFETALSESPTELLKVLGLAIYQSFVERGWSEGRKLTLRIYHYEPVTSLRSLKSNFVGRFVSLRGNVVRVSNVKPLVIQMDFVCGRCGQRVRQHFTDGKYEPPTTCSSLHCRSKVFIPDRESSKTMDWQKLRLQEIDDDQRETGRVPRTIECELTEDLVDACIPGDVVTLSGIVKATSTELDLSGPGRARGKNKKSLYILYVDVNSISSGKASADGPNKLDILQFSTKDLYAVDEIANQQDLFPLLVKSLCPAIFGHEIVKAGLLLALFGGTQKFVGDKNKVAVRGDPHILVVGDPGLGKSQMLQSVATVAPRGIYVGGNTTSTAGLTVTMVKDAATGDYALEAGALILGDQGCCCIDEFDKMGQEQQAFLEAMEQQSVSIAKAGIVCNLSARTAVIAAANPVGGHYNRAKTVGENLKLSAAILSRFDVVYLLLDHPDEQRDQLLSEHIMALHTGARSTTHKQRSEGDLFSMTSSSKTKSSMAGLGSCPWQGEGGAEGGGEVPLSMRLARACAKVTEPIPHVLLRKYIAYARKFVHPRLSEEAKVVLKEFYLTLRQRCHSLDSSPITTRQLESLIRLAEARAKAECREDVTELDAKEAVDLMKESIFETCGDDFGPPLERPASSGTSKSKQMTRFVSRLHSEAEKRGDASFLQQELLSIAQNMNLEIADFRDFLEALNQQNFLLKKGPRTYQLQTSAYQLSSSQRRPPGGHAW